LNYFKLLTFSTLSLLFTACTPQYNIEPQYNKEEKVLKINNYKINDVTYTNTKHRNARGYNAKIVTYKTTDNNCSKLYYQGVQVQNGYYLYSSAMDDILSKYDNDCKVEKIGNLNFYKCLFKQNVVDNDDKYLQKNMHYGITSSSSSEYGFSEKNKIYFNTNYKCFNKIKNYFSSKTEQKYIHTIHDFKKD